MNRTYLKLTLDLDFILIAITAPLKDYVLCHKINTRLNTQFEKIEDHEIFFNIDEPALSFSKYYFFVEQGEVEYYLISNRSSDGLLIPEMSNVDFFIIIKEFIDQEDLNYLINGLNKLPDIQVAAKINPAKLKNKENLVI
ncbi:IPExxxVDY family protein [Pedobacter frigidisoli]|uniref:IPExxxVDY family protein n=1 Tax=Pedobacter frigidisoli TaxID=2530455 RepID=A0A4R0P7I5_9SPHI|nr:IPExxxVDY family protein [Pedobacter frigidisoli]TCD12675.1 IPExxxVDY family protein [Pedobacter frigidisoli]